MDLNRSRVRLIAWQAFFLLFSTSWLMAPALDRGLSYRTSLISQYETSGEPYALLFRLCDVIGALLLLWLVLARLRFRLKKIPRYLLIAVAVGMLLDPVLATVCTRISDLICTEGFTINFLFHAIESTLTAVAIVTLALYDLITERMIATAFFLLLQLADGILFATQYASEFHFNTLAQFVYQSFVVLWLVWYCRKHLARAGNVAPTMPFRTSLVRQAVAGWMFVNGLLSIVISLAHIHLLGSIKGLYFAGNNAWLAQHGVVIGVMMLYLSRHLLRGEMRARQLLMVIVGLEVLKYAAITPNLLLVILYAVTYCLLFVTADDFQRGAMPLTRQVRYKDLVFMVIALLVAVLLALVILDRDNRVARIAGRSYDHFTQYALHSDLVRSRHREAALLANTATAFLSVSAFTLLWILFKPYKIATESDHNIQKVERFIERYSNSSEDFFKIWPDDKKYFWAGSGDGYIAYKLVGPVAFALADPITLPDRRSDLVAAFVTWCRVHRFRACFIAVPEGSLPIYEGMKELQIGASALIDTRKFTEQTINDKWWRWKRNRALKEGYHYTVRKPPHSPGFIRQLRDVSDSWLKIDEHQERGFALGYFNEVYLQKCDIHSLQNESGQVVAFTNRLPTFGKVRVATVDLLRHNLDAVDAMPYLLSCVIESSLVEGYRHFDMGFVPFAGAKGPLLSVARTLGAGRFSAKGLEQFKNKFDPEWQASYLLYDGDVADLALIALNLEKAMALNDESQKV